MPILDKRIKDLAITATSPAADDYIPIDGTLNKTRKILADSFAMDEEIPLVPTFVYDGAAGTVEFIVGDIPSEWKLSNTDLTQLSIGNSVTSIGGGAFQSCSGFTGSLTIPNSVTSIGSYAFFDCAGFTGSLTIPNSVTSIGDGAFQSCSGLATINCYVTRTIMNAVNALVGSGVTTINVRASDGTWTAGADTIGGKAVTVVKSL